MAYALKQTGDRIPGDDSLFERITQDIYTKGYSIQPDALPYDLATGLLEQAQSLPPGGFSTAAVGRDAQHTHNPFVRRDQICWLTGETPIGQQWFNWTAELQKYLNRRLMLGLFSFESHLAHYAPGDFYKRHCDAFKGQQNRILSVVTYLNSQWQNDDGGELVLYVDEHDIAGIRVTPALGTVVAFLSEEFPHEVLPAARDRWSVAGWYRLNSTTHKKPDPPR